MDGGCLGGDDRLAVGPVKREGACERWFIGFRGLGWRFGATRHRRTWDPLFLFEFFIFHPLLIYISFSPGNFENLLGIVNHVCFLRIWVLIFFFFYFWLL